MNEKHLEDLIAYYGVVRLMAQEQYETGRTELSEICGGNEYPTDPQGVQSVIMYHSSPYQALIEMTNDIESMLA